MDRRKFLINLNMVALASCFPIMSWSKDIIGKKSNYDNVRFTFLYDQKLRSEMFNALDVINDYVAFPNLMPLYVSIKFDPNLKSQLDGAKLYIISADLFKFKKGVGIKSDTFAVVDVDSDLDSDVTVKVSLPSDDAKNLKYPNSVYIFCIKEYDFSVIRIDLTGDIFDKLKTEGDSITQLKSKSLNSFDKIIYEQYEEPSKNIYKIAPVMESDRVCLKIMVSDFDFIQGEAK